MNVRKAVKAVLKEAAGEPMKLKKLVRLVKEQADDPSCVTKETLIEVCGLVDKVHVKKGLAWYGAEDGLTGWSVSHHFVPLARVDCTGCLHTAPAPRIDVSVYVDVSVYTRTSPHFAYCVSMRV